MKQYVWLALGLAVAPCLNAQEPVDPHQWLEEVEAPKALEWVEAHNRSTLAELQNYPAYDTLYRRVLSVLTTRERIPYTNARGNHLYNFWTDAQNPRGIWRRTTPVSYATNEPAWETVLDLDSLAAADKTPWAWKGSSCLEPEFRLCLLNLSRGGADAVEVREFDTQTKRFVEGGFFVPQAKSDVTWVDENTLLVGTDFGTGSMTTSGYPRIVKLWQRGTPIAAARTVFEAKAEDVSAFSYTVRVNGKLIPIVGYSPRFFERVSYIMGDSLVRLDLPLEASWSTLGSQLIVRPRADWQVADKTIKSGSLVSIGFDDFVRGSRGFQTIVTPASRQSVESMATTKNLLLVTMLNNVRSELYRYEFRNGSWKGERVPTPEIAAVSITDADDFSDRYFVAVTSFTQPTTLYFAEGSGEPRAVKQLSSLFNEKGLVTEQYEATSKDGTRIPYFIVHRDDIKNDGNNPTLLYGYGGFEVSLTPSYSGTIGSSWLERGGIYVLANIRGGGEFGPEWHKSAMLAHRQRVYDDFFAVAEDVITRGFTSPERLGIMGGSNGGLLMGVSLTQRPELFKAVVIQVPLLDMRRYNKLLAGASWMAEYGNPDKPEDWAFISKYSPYQNVKPGKQYPRVLITTTTRDDRVHPGHARKMAARLEELGYPFYYFENTEGGHGSGVTPEQQAKMWAVTYAYLLKQLTNSPAAPVP